MNYILFDGAARKKLLPFTYTRPVAEIRIGILTIREKWETFLNSKTSTQTEAYLATKWPKNIESHNIFINAHYLPTQNLVKIVMGLKENEALFYEDEPIAYFYKEGDVIDFENFAITQYSYTDLIKIENTWDIFSKNDLAIVADFILITKNRTSQPIPETSVAFNAQNIFIEEGAVLPLCSLNANEGPIYIGKNAEIMEGAMIRGPFALCEGATVKMAAKIYTGTTIGPFCKVGGEVSNSVLFGYSNKGHDGFLGNSILGEWCNLGADTNTSNLKNNYEPVRLWNYETENFAKTGLQFCGLMMGDHSKCGINTMFNTGTVVGVSANIFGSGFPRNFIPSFSWGGASGVTTYITNKAFETAKIVMARRKIEFTSEDEQILNHVFQESAKWRKD